MKYLVFLLALACFTAQAAVYKSVNENGEVVYSDSPSPGAKRVKMPKLQTYQPQPVPTLKSIKRPPVKNDYYSSFAFAKPDNDITIRDNLGVVHTELRLVPALDSGRGHLIQFYLDDEPYGPPIELLAVTMSNLERGEHRISASVLDGRGNILISAEDVVVHIHRDLKLPDPPIPVPLPATAR
jgi:hypothetical protein